MALYLRKKDNLNINTQAYLYKWTHIPTQKWYVGSRTTAGSHPADGYSKKYGPAATTIRRWAKNNKNGWLFIPKGVKA